VAIVAVGEADIGPDFFRQNRATSGGYWKPGLTCAHGITLPANSTKLAALPKRSTILKRCLSSTPATTRGFAIRCWGHYLEVGDLEGARRLLKTYGDEPFAKNRPDYYGIGDVTEAMTCMDAIGPAWKKHREAIQWLKKEHGSGNIFKKGDGKSIQ
jgi:hypothetical protein